MKSFLEECDRTCFEDDLCEAFRLEITPATANKYMCQRFKAGCDWTGAEAGWSCYRPSENEKPSTTALSCTHRSSMNADRDQRSKCSAAAQLGGPAACAAVQTADEGACPADANCYYADIDEVVDPSSAEE